VELEEWAEESIQGHEPLAYLRHEFNRHRLHVELGPRDAVMKRMVVVEESRIFAMRGLKGAWALQSSEGHANEAKLDNTHALRKPVWHHHFGLQGRVSAG
jgi:hypothetical protein